MVLFSLRFLYNAVLDHLRESGRGNVLAQSLIGHKICRIYLFELAVTLAIVYQVDSAVLFCCCY